MIGSGPGFRSNTGIARLLGLLALLSTSCAEGSGGVTRMADGVRYEGRFVNPEAYGAYLLGVEREAHGEYGRALISYLEAHSEDPDSPEIWARIGAVRCFASEPAHGPEASRSAFTRGLESDPQYYGNYLERARCAERAHDFNGALEDATAAVARRPEDEPANLLVARLLRALGRDAEARGWLEALHSFHSTSTTVVRALDAARRPPGTPGVTPAPPSNAPARSEAFAELRSGRAERARQRAQIELDADPTNSDAWIAKLAACDALHDDICFETALSSLKTPSLAPSKVALDCLQDLLLRRAGAKAQF